MHVGLVVHDYHPSFGQGRYCVELVNRLRDRVQFTVFAQSFHAPADPQVRQVTVPGWRRNALTTVYSFIPAAERRVQAAGVDLIHAQGLTCWHADVITGHMCNAGRLATANTRWLKPRLFAWLALPGERNFYRHSGARHLIAISHRLAHEIRHHYHWHRPVTVIHHGTDTQQFRPPHDAAERQALRRRFRVEGDRWTWLFVGEAVKGLPQAIEQLAAFPQARLLVVTRSPPDAYLPRARALGVADRLVWHGFEPRPEEAYRAADLFLYANDHDPFGMVVTEAMATGLPVAVGETLGAAELIENRVNGVKFNPHRPDEIHRQLAWLAAHP
ncbi:MAG: glycosyltransferase family 4 protein, partial [Verrucomicrobiota bacterium]